MAPTSGERHAHRAAAQHASCDLGAGRQCAFASGLIPDLLNAALATDQAELHDDIHQLIQQGS